MPHGYTNDTRGDGAIVVKRYVGPDAAARQNRERAMLERLRGVLPVASIIPDAVYISPHLTPSGQGCSLRMSHIEGVHGQELVDAGLAGAVLRSCGATLRQLQSIPLSLAAPDVDHPSGTVLVHGDYGPNNLLFDPHTVVVTGLLDWEWAHVGSSIEDLAWCEWIVRMHHPQHVGALHELFDAYGDQPPWCARRAAMVRRCQEVVDVLRSLGDAGDMAAELWRQRIRVTESWSE